MPTGTRHVSMESVLWIQNDPNCKKSSLPQGPLILINIGYAQAMLNRNLSSIRQYVRQLVCSNLQQVTRRHRNLHTKSCLHIGAHIQLFNPRCKYITSSIPVLMVVEIISSRLFEQNSLVMKPNLYICHCQYAVSLCMFFRQHGHISVNSPPVRAQIWNQSHKG